MDSASQSVCANRATSSSGSRSDGDSSLRAQNFNSAAIFGYSLINCYLENNEDSNCVLSPASVFLCMSMLQHGAKGETRAELDLVLGTAPEESGQKANDVLKLLMESRDAELTLTSANGIFIQTGFEPSRKFISDMRNFFSANVENVDFKSSKGVKKINGWVKRETKEKIKEVNIDTSDHTVMSLINAVYLKGAWLYPFDKYRTKKGQFRVSAQKTVSADFMTTTERFRNFYDPTGRFSLAFFPYRRERGSMFSWEMGILLPDAGMTPADLVTLLEPDSLKWLRCQASMGELAVKLPKFKFEQSSVDLMPLIRQLGVRSALSDDANFSSIRSVL